MSTPEIFIRALGDVFAPKVLWASLFSLLLTLAFFVGTLWALFGGVDASLVYMTQWLEGVEAGLEHHWLLSFFSLVVIAKTLVSILFFLSSAMAVYYLFLMVYSIFMGFFAGVFIKDIGERYYPSLQHHGIGMGHYVWVLVKTVLVSLLLLVLFSPLMFVPLLNILLLIPVFYLFHRLLVLEIVSVLNTKAEYALIQKRFGAQTRLVSALCFAMTLIPIVGVIIYPYYVIVMSHFVYGKTQDLRNNL